MYFFFVFILCCYFSLLIIFIIYTFLHINRGSVIWEFFYYLIQGIPMSFFFILCTNSVYYTFIFILWYSFFLLILFIIYTLLHLIWGYIIWSFNCYLIQGILMNLYYLFRSNSVYFTFFCHIIFFSRYHHDHLDIFLLPFFEAFRLVSISCSEISLCVSSSFLSSQSSITTWYESSRY